MTATNGVGGQHAHLLELLDFLHDRNPQVRQIALHELIPYSAASNAARNIFLPKGSGLLRKPEDARVLTDLKALCEDQEMTAHDALSILINLSDSQVVANDVADPDFLGFLVATIANPRAVLADLCCMLLSNLTKSDSVCHSCLALAISSTIAPSIADELGFGGSSSSSRPGSAMDVLVEVFARGEGKKLNKHANFDFLASVFANFSAIPKGRDYLLGQSPYDASPSSSPISNLKSFTSHPSIIRRGGVASTLKNSCFSKPSHRDLLCSADFNVLPYILLPLCSGTPSLADLHPEDEERLPVECQLLDPEKKTEPDPAVRAIFVEALLLLATTAEGREEMRDRRVYRIVQLLHESEPEEKIKEYVERLVNLLERPEGPETKIEEVPVAVTDDDFALEEV